MKYFLTTISIFLLLTMLSCSKGNIRNTETENRTSSESKLTPKALKESVLVVRFNTYRNKIAYLRQQLSNQKISSKSKLVYQKQMDEATKESQDYLTLLRSGFNQEFHFSKVLFVPDTLFGAFKMGNQAVFIGKDNKIDTTISLQNKTPLVIIQDVNSFDNLLLVNKNGNAFDHPIPHKKRIFFSSFKRIWNRETYLTNQIKWFNMKLTNLAL